MEDDGPHPHIGAATNATPLVVSWPPVYRMSVRPGRRIPRLQDFQAQSSRHRSDLPPTRRYPDIAFCLVQTYLRRNALIVSEEATNTNPTNPIKGTILPVFGNAAGGAGAASAVSTGAARLSTTTRIG